jgi:chromosome segregation ATPase
MCASRTLAIVLAAFLALPGATLAQSADKKADAAREQARRLQQANRKLEQDKTQLAKEKAETEGKLKEAEEKLGDVQRKVAGANRRAADLTKDLEAQRAEKEKLAGQLAETEKRLAETGDKLRKEEGERKRLEALAAQQKQSIAQCEGLNAKLHEEGLTLLERYRKKSCLDATLQAEPFTGLKQVEIENFVEDYREKLDQLKVDAQVRR